MANLAGFLFEFCDGYNALQLDNDTNLHALGERLRLSAATEGTLTDYTILDPGNSGMWCSTSWDYNYAEQLQLESYNTAFIHFLVVYSVVEALKESTIIGRSLTSRQSMCRHEFRALDHFPGSKILLTNAASALRPYMTSSNERTKVRIQGKHLTLSHTHFEIGNDLVRSTRHHVVHGNDSIPHPGDHRDQFRAGEYSWFCAVQTSRLLRMTSLSLGLIQVFLLNEMRLPVRYRPSYQFLNGEVLDDERDYDAESVLWACNPRLSIDTPHLDLLTM